MQGRSQLLRGVRPPTGVSVPVLIAWLIASLVAAYAMWASPTVTAQNETVDIENKAVSIVIVDAAGAEQPFPSGFTIGF